MSESWYNADEWEYIRVALDLDKPTAIINPDVRVRRNCTYCAWEEIYGGFVEKGDEVIVLDPESGTCWPAEVSQIAENGYLVYFKVDWGQGYQPNKEYREPVREGTRI